MITLDLPTTCQPRGIVPLPDGTWALEIINNIYHLTNCEVKLALQNYFTYHVEQALFVELYNRSMCRDVYGKRVRRKKRPDDYRVETPKTDDKKHFLVISNRKMSSLKKSLRDIEGFFFAPMIDKLPERETGGVTVIDRLGNVKTFIFSTKDDISISSISRDGSTILCCHSHGKATIFDNPFV